MFVYPRFHHEPPKPMLLFYCEWCSAEVAFIWGGVCGTCWDIACEKTIQQKGESDEDIL